MSRKSRREKAEHHLRDLEQQFLTDLISALRDCAAGRWGLFGHNDHIAQNVPYLRSHYIDTAQRLIEQGEVITRLRDELGFTDSFPPLERYLQYRQLTSANAPGEPKLAVQFLKELGIE